MLLKPSSNSYVPIYWGLSHVHFAPASVANKIPWSSTGAGHTHACICKPVNSARPEDLVPPPPQPASPLPRRLQGEPNATTVRLAQNKTVVLP